MTASARARSRPWLVRALVRDVVVVVLLLEWLVERLEQLRGQHRFDLFLRRRRRRVGRDLHRNALFGFGEQLLELRAERRAERPTRGISGDRCGLVDRCRRRTRGQTHRRDGRARGNARARRRRSARGRIDLPHARRRKRSGVRRARHRWRGRRVSRRRLGRRSCRESRDFLQHRVGIDRSREKATALVRHRLLERRHCAADLREEENVDGVGIGKLTHACDRVERALTVGVDEDDARPLHRDPRHEHRERNVDHHVSGRAK